MTRPRLATAVALLSFLGGTAFLGNSLATAGGRDDVADAKVATARFHSIVQAESAGYGELADAAGITCIQDAMGGMGTHFVNGARVTDGVLDVTKPELLLYDRSNGRDELLGVEYVIFADEWSGARPPALFGKSFTRIDSPNRYGLGPFYELHVWLWEDNPAGMFKDWNPNIHC